MRALAFSTGWLFLVSAASAGGFATYAGKTAGAQVPLGDYGTRADVYQDPYIGIYRISVQPGQRRPFYRAKAEMISVVLHKSHISAVRGKDHISLTRGDCLYNANDAVDGSWRVSPKEAGPLDMLVIAAPPAFPEDAPRPPVGQGASHMHVGDARRGFSALAAARAKLDAGKGSLRRTTLASGGAMKAELLSVSANIEMRKTTSGGMVLLGIGGTARVRIGKASRVLASKSGFAAVAAPGEAVRVEPLGGKPFLLLLVAVGR